MVLVGRHFVSWTSTHTHGFLFDCVCVRVEFQGSAHLLYNVYFFRTVGWVFMNALDAMYGLKLQDYLFIIIIIRPERQG